jgi:hypothetical protein
MPPCKVLETNPGEQYATPIAYFHRTGSEENSVRLGVSHSEHLGLSTVTH